MVYSFDDRSESDIISIMDEVLEELNQNSILVEKENQYRFLEKAPAHLMKRRFSVFSVIYLQRIYLTDYGISIHLKRRMSTEM